MLSQKEKDNCSCVNLNIPLSFSSIDLFSGHDRTLEMQDRKTTEAA